MALLSVSATVLTEMPPPIQEKLAPHIPATFRSMPPEVHAEIFKLLNPIDAICMSLTTPSLYKIFIDFTCVDSFWKKHTKNEFDEETYTSPLYKDLLLGHPDSKVPVPLDPNRSCKFCSPVLFHPAHCELHHHLRRSTTLIPAYLTFCSGPCNKFTAPEMFLQFSEAHLYCSTCDVAYRERYAQGRMRLGSARVGPGPLFEKPPKYFGKKRR